MIDKAMTRRTLETLSFDNTYARLPQAFHARVNPTPFSASPHLVHANPVAAELITLDPGECARPEFAALFGGSVLASGMEPLAMLYSGHQFGVYVPQLGDGRAILLGEATNDRGERWDLQLKGAGMTPFSRDGDGRAVLRSTIREYLCCAAMQGLGIPTTQALCLLGSDDKVYREQIETGAMLVRMAPSHVRFGSFEIFYYRKQHEHLKTLADYVIQQHFTHLHDDGNKYARFFTEVVERTARLIAQWQAVGWAHGVMNTDNMSILGLTLDYGPYGFMDDYDAGFICNHSDHNGRYAFNQQPYIGLWNLSCLAQALLPLAEKDVLKAGLDAYQPRFEREYLQGMRAKLGFTEEKPEDDELIRDFLGLLQGSHADYAIVFRELGTFSSSDGATNDSLREHFLNPDRFDTWAVRYRDRLRSEDSHDGERCDRMHRVNPKYVLRNYLAQTAIEKAQSKDFSEIDRLFTLLQDPFTDQPGMEAYALPPPNWGKHLAVSCSS
ncbi:MAG: YdiU family protein [Nitrospira sp.]|nr:YdiU family protein [Nitrospira sp.]MDH5495894.1 YdiU family protein [Nitrospira sp.]MDH5725335.1 YdiU family protein [Nitrospira sp.]